MWKWIVGIAALIVLVLLGRSVLGGGVAVETAAVERGAVRALVDELATTRFPSTRVVSTPWAGRALPVRAREGDRVEAGAVVARMDTEQLLLRIDEAEAAAGQVEARIVENDDDRLERTLIEQIEATLVSIDRVVEAAQERVVAGRARAELLAEEARRIEQSYEQGASTEIELQRARVLETEGRTGLNEDVLTLRATEAVRVAARIAPRLVRQYIDKKALTRATLERERAEAEAVLARLRDDLARAEMAAPVSGVVVERRLTSERVLPAGEPLLEIGRLEDLEVEVEMLTTDAATVSVGDEAELYGEAVGDEPIPARVARVYPEGFTKRSSLGVEEQRVLVILELTAEALKALRARSRTLGAEYRVRARVITGRASDAVAAPRLAVFREADGTWAAFVVEGGRARKRSVEVGLMNDRSVQVTSGLEAGERVILAPPTDLADGTRVEASW